MQAFDRIAALVNAFPEERGLLYALFVAAAGGDFAHSPDPGIEEKLIACANALSTETLEIHDGDGAFVRQAIGVLRWLRSDSNQWDLTETVRLISVTGGGATALNFVLKLLSDESRDRVVQEAKLCAFLRVVEPSNNALYYGFVTILRSLLDRRRSELDKEPIWRDLGLSPELLGVFTDQTPA